MCTMDDLVLGFFIRKCAGKFISTHHRNIYGMLLRFLVRPNDVLEGIIKSLIDDIGRDQIDYGIHMRWMNSFKDSRKVKERLYI